MVVHTTAETNPEERTMAKTTTTFTLSTGTQYTATITRDRQSGLGEAFYFFNGEKIHVSPAYNGQPERAAVSIGFGRPADQSGHHLTGLTVKGHLLTGSLTCFGEHMAPGAHGAGRSSYPLGESEIADAGIRAEAVELTTAIAAHFFSTAPAPRSY